MTSKLAIHGGPKAVTESLPAWPIVDDDDRKAVLGVLESGHWWMYGPRSDTPGAWRSQVEQFEREFADFHRVKHGIAVSSGSVALEVCVRSMGIKAGDEIITTPYTFIATATCILNMNALPVFVDIDPDTYNLDPRKIEEAITPRTKAILPVHFSGELADMDAINAVARKHGLKVLEDASHAHGAALDDGRSPGAFGVAGTFSFQESKNLTCGEGGMILTNDDAFADLCWSLRHYGRDRTGAWYGHSRIGWNGRMTEFAGGLLRSQLKKLPAQIATRQENVNYLYKRLAELPGQPLRPVKLSPRGKTRSHHLVMLRFNAPAWDGVTRDAFLKAAVAESLPMFAGYSHALYRNPLFDNTDFSSRNSPYMCGREKAIDYRAFAARCPVTERACKEEAVWMTQVPCLGSRKMMDQIADGVAKLHEHRRELMAINEPAGAR